MLGLTLAPNNPTSHLRISDLIVKLIVKFMVKFLVKLKKIGVIEVMNLLGTVCFSQEPQWQVVGDVVHVGDHVAPHHLHLPPENFGYLMVKFRGLDGKIDGDGRSSRMVKNSRI